MIKMGDLVKDRISGFEGVVVAVSEYLYNADRVCVRPNSLNEDGSLKDSNFFDNTSVDIIQKNSAIVVPAPSLNSIPFNYLDTVKDKHSDFKGVVVAKITWINGCVRIGIQPYYLEKCIPADECFLPYQQLKLVKKSKEVVIKPADEIPTGGPRKNPNYVKDPKF